MVLLVLLLIVIGLLIGGLVAVLLAEDRTEEHLVFKGMGYALLGNILINIGPIPIPLTQIIGFMMASNAKRNVGAKQAAWAVGFFFWILSVIALLWSQ